MHRLVFLFSISALLLLPACEQREQAQAPSQAPAVATSEPAQPPPASQPAPAGTEVQRPAGGEQAAQTPTAQQPPAQQPGQEQTAMAREPGQEPTAAVPPAEQQQTSQSREGAEFYGQSPKVEDAPETVVLQAKNGNVTLPHREHAGRMECKTCHGEAKPAKMADFNKDKAHPLCQGCHKEQGAGPTKCPDCHKK